MLGIALMGASGAVAQSDVGTLKVTLSPAKGIGPEEGVMRRDPSDIIKVNDRYYVWYSKGPQAHGYNATIWYATSQDGHTWTEKGEALGRGPVSSWDEQSVFTPNILVGQARYWLFYTAVPKPFINKGPNITKTAIGLAVSDSPDGPWDKLSSNPVLRTSEDHDDFDSLRVDDACLIVREGKYWLYYKGRQWNKSPGETKMGLAIADTPQGKYVKHAGNPIIHGNHEVLVWPQGAGVSAMIGTTGPKSITRSIMHAEDGLHFSKTHNIVSVPHGAGAYRVEAFTNNAKGERIEWGVHIGKRKGFLPFIERYELN
jgi:sucrose-6-phosphate hydrolase SacC (GH32 family)